MTDTWIASTLAAVLGGTAGLAGRTVLGRLPNPRPRGSEVDHSLTELAVDDALVRRPGAELASGRDRAELVGEPPLTPGDETGDSSGRASGELDPSGSPYAPLVDDPRTTVVLVVLGGLACGVAGGAIGWNAALPAWIALGIVGTWVAYIDARTRYLPTALIGPGYVVVVVLLVAGALLGGHVDRLLPAVYGWLVFGGFYLLMWVVYRRGIGYGDVRLAGLLGPPLGFVGWGATLTALYAGLILGAVVGSVLVLTRLVKGRSYPFGPFMVAGAILGLLWGRHLGGWYSSL